MRATAVLLFAAALAAALGAGAEGNAAEPRKAQRPALPPPPTTASTEYQACLTLAGTRPDEAFEQALTWQVQGGGAAARHCAAVALLGMGQPDTAAERLEQIAAESTNVSPRIRADLLGQAGQAWMIAGEPVTARAVLTEGLRLQPDDPELLLDRAQAFADSGDLGQAVSDLSRVVDRNPRRTEALILRAAANRRLGDLAKALADSNQALRVAPGDPEAHLERGIVYRLQGHTNDARTEFLAVLVAAPDGEIGDAARYQIERLELGLTDPPPPPPVRRAK